MLKKLKIIGGKFICYEEMPRPAYIRLMLKLKEVNQSDIAREVARTPAAVSLTIDNKLASPLIKNCIAKNIGLSVEELFGE